jgi:hypothetical protein
VTLYDDAERARERGDDLDGDGLVDARSFYENGKLARRELIDEAVTEPLVEEEQLGTPEGFSDGSEPGPARRRRLLRADAHPPSHALAFLLGFCCAPGLPAPRRAAAFGRGARRAPGEAAGSEPLGSRRSSWRR